MSKKRIETIQRLANVSSRQALKELQDNFPGSELIDFNRKGRHYIAKIRVSNDDVVDVDVPPSADPGPEPDSFDSKPDFNEFDESEDHMDSEMDKLDEIKDLLSQIANAVGVAGDDDDEGDDEDSDDEVVLDGSDFEDVPPPVEEPENNSPSGVFASVKQQRHFTATRKAEDGLTDGQIVREAAQHLPNHEVVRIDREKRASEGIVLVLMRHKG